MFYYLLRVYAFSYHLSYVIVVCEGCHVCLCLYNRSPVKIKCVSCSRMVKSFTLFLFPVLLLFFWPFHRPFQTATPSHVPLFLYPQEYLAIFRCRSHSIASRFQWMVKAWLAPFWEGGGISLRMINQSL